MRLHIDSKNGTTKVNLTKVERSSLRRSAAILRALTAQKMPTELKMSVHVTADFIGDYCDALDEQEKPEVTVPFTEHTPEAEGHFDPSKVPA